MSGMDRYYERKKEKSNALTTSPAKSGMDRYYENKYYKSLNINNDFINSFISDTNNFLGSAEEAYKGITWGNASSTYDSQYATWKDLDTRAKAINWWLEHNKSNIDEDSYNSLSDTLKSVSSGTSSVIDAFKGYKDYYSQWETEDDYNSAIKSQKDYEDLLSFDLESGKVEINNLESIANVKKQIAEIEAENQTLELAKAKGSKDAIAKLEENKKRLPILNNTWEHACEVYGGEDELKALLSQKKQYYTLAERAQNAVALTEDALKATDFEQYAQIGANIENPSFNNARIDKSNIWSLLFDKDIENIVTFARDNKENLNTMGAMSSSSGDVGIVESYLKYTFMTNDEVKVYNYYLGKGDTKKAEEYLTSLEDTLNSRRGAQIFDNIEDNTFLEYVFGVSAGLDQFSTGIINLFSNEDYIPTTSTQYASGMIRDDLEDTGAKLPDWMGGASLGQAGYDMVTTTSNMLPSILVSYIPYVGQVAGPALLGASAAGNAKSEMLRLGYSKEQANTYGLLVGASEGALQYLLGGISKLGGKASGNIIAKIVDKIDNGLARTAITLGGNMVSEGVEEALQSILEPYFKAAVTYEDLEGIDWAEVVYSGLLGMMSAGLLEGGPTVINAGINANRAKNIYGDSTAELITEALEINPDNAYAAKLKERLDSGKSLTGTQINRIVEMNENVLNDSKATANPSQNETLTVSEEQPYEAQPTKESADESKTADETSANTVLEIKAPSSAPQVSAQQEKNAVTTESPTEKENATEGKNEALESDEETDDSENTVTLAEASKKYGAQAQAMIHTYTEGQNVAKYDNAYKAAYDMGMSGVSLSYVKNSNTTAYLTETQKELAYEAGRAAADNAAKEQDKKNKNLANGKTGRKKGTVKGEGVTVSDLKKAFNDTQNKAYKILSSVAEATGIDIVLYKSDTDADGNFIGSQGKFKWSEDKIYIDINAGLRTIYDVDDLAQYAMLRTFSHEFTHFIEKWNPIWYNEFRKAVFDTLSERGENVHELIEIKKAMNEDMSYDMASRELVAEAMTDILPDTSFIETLATKHKNIFEKLLEKLKEFLSDIKAYFKTIGHNPSREANALKEQVEGAVHYVDNIVKLFDKVALEAVENYQASAATEEVYISEFDSNGNPIYETIENRKPIEPINTVELKEIRAQAVKEFGLSDKQASSLDYYIMSLAYAVNRKLNSGNVLDSDRSYIDSLTGALKKFPVFAGRTYRNLKFRNEQEYNAFLEENSTGNTVILKAFTSTSKKPNGYSLFGKYVVHMVFDGVSGRDIADTYGVPRQQEVLFLPGTRYDVNSVSKANDGNILIFAKEIVTNEVQVDNGNLGGGEFELNRDAGSNRAILEGQEYDNVRVLGDERRTENAGAGRKKVLDAVARSTDRLQKVSPKEQNTDTNNTEEVNQNGETENADNERPILEPDTDGQRASRLLDESQAADVRGTSSERNAVGDTRQRESETSRDGDRTDADAGDSRSKGSSESGDIRRDGGLTEQKATSSSESLTETVEREIEQKSTESPKGNNFVIGDSLNLPDGEKARYHSNVAAIRLIKQLESEGRYATPTEQEILSKYVGWGGLDKAFGEYRYNRDTRRSEMTAKDGWEKEFAELKSLVDDGIITEQEYKDMSASTKNAHYTSIEVIKAMYDGLAGLGFSGGRMLEPSSGVGNFVGAMPADMSAKVSSWTMVELDRITGLIAKYLYPNSDVRIQGFENANIPDNYMDVAIGNVPFGNFGVVDRAYPKRITKAIHNYFFAKSIDKVRPGGIVMFITSSFTMNSNDTTVRKYIMERADLLGAIRLPNTAFKGNAGTEVVTDILILKKRESDTEYAGEDFLEADYDNNYGNYVSNYFKNHPEMVLGKPVTKSGMYGARTLTFEPFTDRGSIDEQIREAFKNIKGKMSYPSKSSPEKTNFALEKATKKSKSGGFVVHSDGSISRNENGQLVKYDTDEKTAKRIAGMLEIRDAYKKLANYLQQGVETKYVKQARTALNTAYDSFVKEFGYINSPANRKAIDSDPDSYSILSLENYDTQKKIAKKADIFDKDTISANKTVTHVDTVEEGVIASINLTGGVDASFIAKLTSKTVDDVTRDIIDSRLAFKTRSGALIARESYLSGNVRAKLREAEALAPYDQDFNNNVEELKKVIPADIPYNEIYITPGATFIPNEVYADFIAHMLGGRNNQGYGSPDVEVGRTASGEFKIILNNKRLKNGYYNTQTWGTARKSFLDLIDAMMGSRTVRVNDVIESADGKKVSVINEAETEAANEKVKAIQKEFEDWLWKDENRRTALARLYNETFNAIVNPRYDGSHLSVNGISADYALREHQANAVHRIIASGGNTLLAHRVGAGKTLEMAAAAMKMRELGVIKKPVFVVPKSVVAQWGVEFHSYFPAARLLVADDKSFTPANRKIFTNKIANGDYDAVIVSYEQFEKIPMSAEYQQSFYEEQINEIIAAIAEEKAESRDGKGLTVKEMEKKKAQLEKKLKELTSKPKDENNVDFEMLGIDSLFVDEAHNFKNLEYVSRMSNVAGLGSAKGSQRAFDLYTKIRYLQGLNGGRGVVFATATPVMNSMVELYIMQRYLQPDVLNQLGLKSFDAWAKQFGEVVNKWEINPSGTGMRQKQVFANFRNLNELQLLFRSFADVLTEVPGLKIPKMKGGAVKIIECEPGEFQKAYMQELQKRAENVKNVDPAEDNMLKITSDGRKVSYTQRMIDPTLPYEPDCKIFKASENIFKEYQDSADIKGTQIVFLDMATPKGTDKNKTETNTDNSADDSYDEESARLYEDMRDYLVKKGIPKREISFIHEADSDAKRKQLFENVNNGKVRVLIGSTGKMGVGMNAQKRVVAIHHLDAPWRPGDVEQRDGRAFRQKNINEEVSKYVYVTKGSFDSRLWDILDRKQHFINQIMNGEDVGRTAEDTGEVTLSAAEVKALASGNPLIEEQTKLTDEIKKLENLQKAYNSSIRLAKAKFADDETKIANYKNRIARIREDIAARVDTYSEGKFSMTVGNQVFSEKKDAGVALAAAISAKTNIDAYVTVGTFAGFELRAIKSGAEYHGSIQGKENYKFNVYLNNTTRMVNHIGEIIAGFENMIMNSEQIISDLSADRDAQQHIIAQPFEKQNELNAKRARFNEVMELLAPKSEEQLGKTDDNTVQDQSRSYLVGKQRRKSKVPQVDEFSTYSMQWARSDKTEIGEQKLFYRNGKWVLLEKSDSGFVEMGTFAADRYNFIKKEIDIHNEELHDRGNDERIYRSALRYENLGSSDSRNNGDDVGEQAGNGQAGELYQAKSVGNRSTDNEKGESNNGNSLDLDEQNQQRTVTLTDREVLELAANEIDVSDLTQAEKDALTIFQDRLSNLKDLQSERAEQGKLYKEQQFGEKVNKDAATETLNRMHVLDSKIRKATAELLTVEEKDVLKRVLQKARKVVEVQVRQHDQEILKRWRDRRDNAAAIKKYRERLHGDVNELSNWIVNPSNKDIVKHVPDVLKNTVIPFLTSINFTSKRALKGGEATKADAVFTARLEKLNAALKTNIELTGLYSGYNDLPPNFMENLQNFINSTNALVKKQSGDFVINLMTSEELKELSQIVRTLKKYITQINRFHYNAMFEHVYEAGENSIQHLKELGSAGNTGTFSAFLLWQQIRPAYAFERFGKGGEAIYDELRRGQATLAFNTKEIQEFTERTYTEKEVKAWENEIKTFTLGKDVVKMPVSYIMAFYELSKDPEALNHINGEGIRVATYTHNGKKISDTGHIITVGELNQIIGSLTDRQKEVADALQKYMSEQGGKWGNYVSVARFGEELFTNKRYFPINSDGRHLQANADESPSAASLYALLNMSFTKSRKEGANNRIVIYSIFDVFANHMASMAQYNAMALPILDALKWFNYQQVLIDDAGIKHVGDSVRERMDRAYGVPEETRPGKGKSGYAQDFVMNIIKAFNGTEAQGTPYDSLALKSLHRYNIAQVAYNLRVAIQQPLAITRAGMLVDYTSILKGMKLNPASIKKNIEEMQKYSGIAAWKSLGFYDVNISKGLTHVIKHDSSAMDKISDFGMWGAEKADLLTWAAIWSAAKEEVVKKQHLSPTSDGFYEAVTKLFEDIIYKTQVVDSVLTKNEFMRDKGAFARLISSFMSEPTTNASMLIDAYDKYALDIQRGMTKQQAWKKNRRIIGRRLYVYAVGAILLAAVQAAADALRDDDDYEEWYEKWLEAFGGNLVDELMPFNKLPILSDFYDLAKELLSIFGVDTYGNPPQSVFMQWYDSLIKGTEIIYEKISGEDTNYTWYGGIYKLLQAASGITGLPMASATREIITAWNNTVGAMAPSLKIATYEPSELSEIRYAYEDGYLTEKEATEQLLEKGLADTEDEAYFIIQGWEAGENYSRYDKIYDAVRNGASIDEAMNELTSHGYSKDEVVAQIKGEIGRWYRSGEISKQQATDMLTKYSNMDNNEIKATVSYWEYKKNNPDADVNVGMFEKYYSDIAHSGISINTYIAYRNDVKAITGDDKKAKRMAVIDSLPITDTQKDTLYYAEGWSESKLYEAPWH